MIQLNNFFVYIYKTFFNLNYNFTNSLGIFSNDLLFFMFEIFFIFSFIVILIFFVILSNKKLNSRYLNISGSFLNFLPFIVLILIYLLNNSITYPLYLFNGFYYSDFSSISFKNILLAFFLIFIFSLKDYVNFYKKYDFEFLIVLFLSFFSSVLIINSNDLLSLFFIIELQSLTFYILVASKQASSFSTEAGLKYFVLSCFSSGVILFGISLIYGFTGLLSYSDLMLYSSVIFNSESLYDYFFSFTGFVIGLLFLTVGLFFKFGSVPFHMWLPDVYEGAPLIITAYLSTIPKLPLAYIFFKLYYGIFFNIFFLFQNIFILSAILSIMLGSIAAIYQIKIKRLLTYSMITNTGYLILGLSLGDVSGVFVTLFYLVSYVFIMLGIFFIFISLRDRTTGFLVKKISSLLNLFEINALLALSLFILLFSIAGIPPLLGFYSKLFLFLFVLKLEMYWVALLFVVFSVISVFYYIRLVKLSYFNKSSGWVFFKEISFDSALIISFITILNCVFFVNPNLIFKLIYNITFYIIL